MDEVKTAQVVLDARDQNSWHVIGLINDRHRQGSHRSGVIAFVDTHRAANPIRGFGHCGTARFYVDENGDTVFWSGAYDLHREEAICDLVGRGCRMTDDDRVNVLPNMVRA